MSFTVTHPAVCARTKGLGDTDMNIAITDDDNAVIERLSLAIKEYGQLNDLDIELDIFKSAKDILKDYHPYAYTAIFMDIYTDGKDNMTGIDAAREILGLDRGAIIIFLTSSGEHMPDVFALHAYDYIQKPASKERIFKVMDDVMMQTTRLLNEKSLNFISNRENKSLAYPDIVMIRTAGRNLEITDVKGNKYETRMGFSKVKDILKDDPRFLTLIRGVIVNMDFVANIEGGFCTLEDETKIPVNVKGAKKLDTIWQNYKLESMRKERAERRGHK